MFRKLFVRLNVKCIAPTYHRASLVPQLVVNLPAMWETWVRSLGWKNPLEEGVATYSNILAWRIPMDRGAWWATVHGVTKSRTRLSNFIFNLTNYVWITINCGKF